MAITGSSEQEFSAIGRRLLAPARQVSLDELRAIWFQARISIRVAGYAALAHDLVLLRRIRGALGRVLMEGASAEALAGHPCPWQPPCALEVLFREQGRAGSHGIPKPFVLAAERRGPDLVVSLTLFGLASDWAGAVGHALASALRHRIDWRGQRNDLFLPKPEISALVVRSWDGLDCGASPRGVEMEFLTPVNAEGDDPLERPGTIIARLARRLDGLARWQDATVVADWRGLASRWDAADYDVRGLVRGRVVRRSGRSLADFTAQLVSGSLRIEVLPEDLWPILAIGREIHVGKGANAGFGRFALRSA